MMLGFERSRPTAARGARQKPWLATVSSAAVLGLCLLGIARSAAAADAPVKTQVLVILAKEEPGEIDPKLKQVRALQKPPFNGFKSMKVLSTSDVELSADQAATVALPNGRTLQIKLLARMPDGRNKVQVSINRPEKPDYLPLLTVIASGEPFFVAGQRYEGGTLVIGVRVGEAK
ncbi:MAG: hypothetical protein ACHQ53_00050 [Polyangiales bacterium]